MEIPEGWAGDWRLMVDGGGWVLDLLGGVACAGAGYAVGAGAAAPAGVACSAEERLRAEWHINP